MMRVAFAFMAALLACAAPARAQEQVRLVEQQIKAAMIYNFLKYTDWPSGRDDAPIVVCEIGVNPLDGRLADMAGRTVNQRTIELRAVQGDAESAPCAVVFLDGGERARWPKLKAEFAGREVLTISDFDGFATAGGMIEFTRRDNRIGVAINADAVASAHLTVEDRLLRLASAVRGAR